MGNQLPKPYSTDFEDLKNEICTRYRFSKLGLEMPLADSPTGFVCKVKATDSDKKTECMAVKVTYAKSNEYNLDLDDIIIRSPCPNLVKIYDVQKVEGRAYKGYVLMECCKESLENKKLPESEVWRVLKHVLQGLKVLHDNGFIHRDIKPANILVRVGDTPVYVLADFGITRAPQEKMTAWAGTKHYIAPEVQGNNYSLSADIYSLGLSALTLLVGFVVVPNTPANIDRVIAQAECSDQLKNFLTNMVKAEPTERPSVDELIDVTECIPDIAKILEDLVDFTRTAQRVQEHCKNVKDIHSEILGGVTDWVGGLRAELRDYLDLCYEYNRSRKVEDATTMHQLVDGIVNDCTTFTKLLDGYVLLIDEPVPELRALKQELKSRIDKKTAMLAGTGTGVAVGSGVTSTLVAVPTSMFGAAGAFVVAGSAFPPVLIILGGAAVLAGLGFGLATLIKFALNQGNKKLLKTVTNLIAAIISIKDSLKLIKAQMMTIQMHITRSTCKPVNTNLPVNAETIKALEKNSLALPASVTKLEQVKIPQIPGPLAVEVLPLNTN